MKSKPSKRKPEHFATGVGRALRRVAKDAQKIARMYNTPLYYWENGRRGPRVKLMRLTLSIINGTTDCVYFLRAAVSPSMDAVGKTSFFAHPHHEHT